MFFEIDNSGTTSTASNRVTTTKKQSSISRNIFDHPPPPLSPSPPSTAALNKRGPLLQPQTNSSSCSGRFAELAGGTTAECAAICCCCPCGLVNLIYLTIYKVPAGLCRRALMRRKRRKKKLMNKGCYCGFDNTEVHIYPTTGTKELSPDMKSREELSSEEEEGAMMKFEEQMWEAFYSSGFWRSPSQKEHPPKIPRLESTLPNEVKQL